MVIGFFGTIIDGGKSQTKASEIITIQSSYSFIVKIQLFKRRLQNKFYHKVFNDFYECSLVSQVFCFTGETGNWRNGTYPNKYTLKRYAHE